MTGKRKMPTGVDDQGQQLAEILNGMLVLLEWMEQLVSAALRQVPQKDSSAPGRPGRKRAKPRRTRRAGR